MFDNRLHFTRGAVIIHTLYTDTRGHSNVLPGKHLLLTTVQLYINFFFSFILMPRRVHRHRTSWNRRWHLHRYGQGYRYRPGDVYETCPGRSSRRRRIDWSSIAICRTGFSPKEVRFNSVQVSLDHPDEGARPNEFSSCLQHSIEAISHQEILHK